jgi:hypothetical protein
MILAQEYLWQAKAEIWFYQNILTNKMPMISSPFTNQLSNDLLMFKKTAPNFGGN